LETEDGTFQAGIGDIIVHNTDSVYTKFYTDHIEDEVAKRQYSMDVGIIVGERTTHYLKSLNPFLKPEDNPIDLEYEKVFHPLLLFTKKRYTGPMYEWNASKPKYTDAKGIVLTRRDNCKFVRDCYGDCLDVVLKEKDVTKAIKVLDTHIERLRKHEVPLKDLTISKSLRMDYKTPETIPHLQLAIRMAERDPGSAPKVNDRVPYVFIEQEKFKSRKARKNMKQTDVVEHPDYVSKNGLRIDALYYLEHALMSPLISLFEILVPHGKEWDAKKNPGILFESHVHEFRNQLEGNQSIMSFFGMAEPEKKEIVVTSIPKPKMKSKKKKKELGYSIESFLKPTGEEGTKKKKEKKSKSKNKEKKERTLDESVDEFADFEIKEFKVAK
jgi:DNA polymerase elongation subunit (family B)